MTNILLLVFNILVDIFIIYITFIDIAKILNRKYIR